MMGFSFGAPAGGTNAPSGATGTFGGSATVAPSSGASFSTHPFQYIQECLDPNSANYRFRYFFYNAVPGVVNVAPTKPPNVTDQLWTQTLNDNPDPTKMVPVLANGFGDLTCRRAWQKEHECAQRGKLDELEQRLALLLTKQDLDVSTQLQVIQKQQLKLTLRVIQLMRRVEVLRRSGGRFTGAEQALLGRVQSIATQLRQAPLSNNCIKNMEGQLSVLAESGRLDPLASARQCVFTDEDSLSILHALLEEQQSGLKAVIETLNKDSRDLDTMRHGFSL